MLTDIQIAQQAKMEPIEKVAESLGINRDELEFYGKYKAKLSDELAKQMDIFSETFEKMRKALKEGDTTTMRQMMRTSTERRKLFDINHKTNPIGDK